MRSEMGIPERVGGSRGDAPGQAVTAYFRMAILIPPEVPFSSTS